MRTRRQRATVAGLRVTIDRSARTATFSGSGTFAAKDEIKKLGRARWNSEQRTWEIAAFALSADELSDKFPGIEIEEEGGEEALPESEQEQQTAGLPKSISVSELTARVRNLLKSAFPSTIFVHGVLSSVKSTKDGRIFMDLAEAERPEERIGCVVWRDSERICKKLHEAGFTLEPDLQVMFEVEVELNRRWSSVSLTVVGIVAEYTIAKLAAMRDRTNEQLKAEGLFERNRQLRLSFLPARLGILTSAGGTVINDFRASLDTSGFGFELFWVDTSVQGSEAKAEIIRGMKLLAQVPHLDAILIFRGGGSPGDLAVFNEYEVAKMVCLCPIPVISAIGHQEDQCSVQDVSFRALGVPKDIGRFFADIISERRQGVAEAVRIIVENSGQQLFLAQQRTADFSRNLYGLVAQMLQGFSEAVERLGSALPLQVEAYLSQAVRRFGAAALPTAALAKQVCAHHHSNLLLVGREVFLSAHTALRSQVQHLQEGVRYMLGHLVRMLEREESRMDIASRVIRAAESVREYWAQRLEALGKLVESAGPDIQLRRGFSLVKRASDGKPVGSGAQLEKNDLIEIQFYDQSREAKIV